MRSLKLTALAAAAVLLAGPDAAVAAAPRQAPPPPASSEAACPDWAMYGADLERTFATTCPSNITSNSVTQLTPAWEFKTLDSKTFTASPVVVDGTLFVGSWDGAMYAIRATTGQEIWHYQTDPAPGAAFGPIVSSAAVAETSVGGERRRLVVFGSGARLHALDAADGSEVWTVDFAPGQGEDTPVEIESSPAIFNGTVYIGVNTHNRPASEAGGEKGSLRKVDLATGQAHAAAFEPDPTGDGCGGIWSSPAIGTVGGRTIAVFGTANCTSTTHTWTDTTEAVIAVDATTLEKVWAFSPHLDDPGTHHNDWDFGATPNLYQDSAGRWVVGAGNKDGSYYRLDAATGTLLGSTQVAEAPPVRDDFSIGGIIGSPSVLHSQVFTATAFGGPPFYHSIDGTGGDLRWQSAGAPSYAASAAVNDVVFSAGTDSALKAFNAQSGAPLWSSPLLGPGSSGPAIVGDWVFVGSGTSSSDACAKDTPISEACEFTFSSTLGSTGGVHAFRLVPPGADQSSSQDAITFNAEDNRLNAYQVDASGRVQKQTVIRNASEGGLDINAQICFDPSNPRRFIAGEDTNQDHPDPAQQRPQGWGYFELQGSAVGSLSARQIGKLTPTYQPSADNPENYGCGFLPGNRLVTTDVGDQQPGTPANGQLIVWFGPLTRFPSASNGYRSDPSTYCVVDTRLGTAGGIHVVGDGSILVAAARGDGTGPTGSVYRYSDLPTSPRDCARRGGPVKATKTTFVSDPVNLPTPSAVAASGRGTYYVSSVFNGVIAEYSAAGLFVRRALQPPPGDVVPPYSTGTPFGIGTDHTGALYYADIGVVAGPPPGPGDHTGTVRRIGFGAGGAPLPPAMFDRNLNFPDGIGVLRTFRGGVCLAVPGPDADAACRRSFVR